MNLRKALNNNIQWITASFVLAFGIWIVAAMQNDPVQQRSFPRSIPIEIEPGPNMLLDGNPSAENVEVVVRAPRSVWDVLRSDQIMIIADTTDLGAGEHRIKLKASLADGIRGRVVELTPAEVVVTLAQRASQRVSVRPVIAQAPPVGYSYAPPTCSLREVTASGAADKLIGLEAVARLNLSEDRSTVEHEVSLVPVNSAGRVVTDMTLDPALVICEVIIAPNEGVHEEIPVEIEGLSAGMSVDVLPKTVTVFVVGPRPLLQALTNGALRVTVDVSDLETGFYQITAEVSIIVEALTEQITADTTITVQPSEINVTISEGIPNTLMPSLP